MGIGPDWLRSFQETCRIGDIVPGQAILDVGASELFCASEPAVLNEFLVSFGAAPYEEAELLRMADRAFAAELFRRAGFHYNAIDYADFPGILRLDLNVDELPLENYGKYNFVNNAGTSEHILNQYNVFKLIHDATAPGGLMYHGVPGWGYYEHGIIGYSPKFFWALATANDYRILRFAGEADNLPLGLRADFMQQIEFNHAPVMEQVLLHVLLRKTADAPFRGLNDPAFSSEWTTPGR